MREFRQGLTVRPSESVGWEPEGHLVNVRAAQMLIGEPIVRNKLLWR